MAKRIFTILGVCYVAFALMASSGTFGSFDSDYAKPEATDSMVKEDQRSDRHSERLSGPPGEGSSASKAAAGILSQAFRQDYGWIGSNKDQIDKQLASFKSNCAIVWTADWCAPCKDMYPIIAELENDGYTIHVVNYDENKPLAAYLKITKLPTTIVWQGRKEVSRHIGLVTTTVLKKTLKKNKKLDYEIW